MQKYILDLVRYEETLYGRQNDYLDVTAKFLF